MSKIARYTGNLRAFGSNAQGLERTLFGETAQADDLTSQVTTSFLRGWGVVGPSENPSLEDFNAAMYTMSQFIAYQHQMGIPEWDALQEYYIGSLCVRAGETYSSLADGNIGSPPPSVKWTPVLTAKNGIANLGLKGASVRDVGTGANQIPDMNSFGASFGASGYQKLPGGLIIQWGRVTTTAALIGAQWSFPIPFPNEVLSYFAMTENSSGDSKYSNIGPISAASRTGAIVSSIYPGAAANSCWAIGY
ncbi:gp53-like domain-containing protein [Yersinia rohdei]|uniref:gp53-like domain-containing protein n=1 Tax=Yersinia rohdei TaxID=29485 RepID=UPI0025AB36DB|nr:carbohydrate-binding protein [Yersinia rohdei]MDN0093485.1 carbohydrate-binding protein [Yersinia rohdei]